jgi:hypothetical protein
MAALQQVTARLAQLESWLQAGGQIEEPVLQRSAYHSAAGRVCIFEVVVNQGGHRQVIALSDDPAVYLFFHRRQLSVLDVT